MIYLFEDRKDRMIDYLGHELINENIRESKFIVPEGQTINEFILQDFKDAQAIIFHKSYRFPDSNITITQVFDSFKKNLNNCQLVSFSGSVETGNYYIDSNNQYFLNINSAIMYSNLKYFMDEFTVTGKVDVRKLLFAENVKKNELLSFYNNAMMVIHSYPKDSQTIFYADFEDFVLERSLRDKELLVIKEEFKKQYGDSNQININELITYINEIVNDYI
jgi:hypothetical protein